MENKIYLTPEEVLMLRDAMKIYTKAVVDNENKFPSPDALHSATFEIWVSINQRLSKKLETAILDTDENFEN